MITLRRPRIRWRSPETWVYGLVAAVVLIVCLLRANHAQSTTAQIALVSVTPWLLLPAIILLGVTMARRRWLLAAVSSFTTVCLALWEVPVLWPVNRAPPASSTGRIRLFDANVAQDNFNLRGIAGEIAADHPDVIALEELTPPAAMSLIKTGVLSDYHWSLIESKPGPGGMGVWSDIPVSDQGTWLSDGTQVEIDMWLHPTGGPAVRFDVIHVYAPVGAGQPAMWRQQLAGVRAHLASEPHPLLVAGDFNATADDEPFQRILGLGLSDAAVLAGRGWEMTWPRNQSWVIPYLRLDHVLLSGALTVSAYRLGVGRGSDHRPVLAVIAPRATQR